MTTDLSLQDASMTAGTETMMAWNKEEKAWYNFSVVKAFLLMYTKPGIPGNQLSQRAEEASVVPGSPKVEYISDRSHNCYTRGFYRAI